MEDKKKERVSFGKGLSIGISLGALAVIATVVIVTKNNNQNWVELMRDTLFLREAGSGVKTTVFQDLE